MTEQNEHEWERGASKSPLFICAKCGARHDGDDPPAGPCEVDASEEFPPGVTVGED